LKMQYNSLPKSRQYNLNSRNQQNGLVERYHRYPLFIGQSGRVDSSAAKTLSIGCRTGNKRRVQPNPVDQDLHRTKRVAPSGIISWGSTLDIRRRQEIPWIMTEGKFVPADGTRRSLQNLVSTRSCTSQGYANAGSTFPVRFYSRSIGK